MEKRLEAFYNDCKNFWKHEGLPGTLARTKAFLELANVKTDPYSPRGAVVTDEDKVKAIIRIALRNALDGGISAMERAILLYVEVYGLPAEQFYDEWGLDDCCQKVERALPIGITYSHDGEAVNIVGVYSVINECGNDFLGSYCFYNSGDEYDDDSSECCYDSLNEYDLEQIINFILDGLERNDE